MQELKKKNKKKNSRQAISAECFGIFNKKSDFVPKVLSKSPQTQSLLKNLLRTTVLFRSLESDDLDTVIQALEEFTIESGQTIIKEGDEGDMLFVVSSGEYQCSKIINCQEKYLKTYVSGEAFG
jgi:cAMP-dependent protein kinase regulator